MFQTRIIDNIKITPQVYIKPEYLIHPFVSGNKFRKLKFNFKYFQENDFDSILTFGGAYSNHIAATAAAGKSCGISTIGLIRGQELEKDYMNNPTLKFAKSCGMHLEFISRELYKNKHTPNFLKFLKNKFPMAYILPEGGTNALAVKGCQEILTQKDKEFQYVCCPVGTGGTIAGLINSSDPSQKIIGFPALKGSFLNQDICKFASQSNWELSHDYHFGGYAKVDSKLIRFINKFKDQYDLPLDPIYTGKMMYGIFDLIDKGKIPESSKILAIHTGGLQGIDGMNLRLKQKHLELIRC